MTAEPAQERLDGARGRPVPVGGRAGALSGPSVLVRPPGSFVLGDKAVVSGRATAWLTSRAGLAELRARVRGEDPEREKAAFLRQVHARHVEQIRGNRDLTEAARARQLTEAYRNTKARMDDLRRTEQQRLAKRETELTNKVFNAGTYSGWMDRGAEAIAARDAADRADRLSKPADAIEVLRRATATGDTQLAGAVGRRAFELARRSLGGAGEAWGEVVDEYLAEHRPPNDAATAELGEVMRATERGAGFDFALMRPPEVPAWGDLPAADGDAGDAP